MNMKHKLCRILAICIALVTLFCLCVPVYAEESENVTVLFTHDLHSHLLPSRTEDGGEYGGYARLMTVINEQKTKYPNAILVDAGDFSMGSLFQTAYTTSAIELRMMGAMGYDVTTFGNHEFDYLPKGLIAMLKAAKDSGDYTPAIVEANYLPPENGEGESKDMWNALQDYGVKDYVILERGGVYFVLFGIFGYDSDDCAPNSGMILEDPIAAAQKTVDAAVAECEQKYGAHPVVICHSHAGTSGGEGEDYEMAENVNGLDLIISGHTHTTLKKAIEVNNTYIVSAGEYGKNLGVVNFKRDADGNVKLSDYTLIPVDETVEDDEYIASLVENFKNNVKTDYLSKYGVGFDEVLVHNTYDFDSVKEVYATQHESTLTNIFSDAYKAAVEKAIGIEVDVALTAAGVIRESLPIGDVTTADVFNAASLGVGTEGELVAIYITGKDLMNVLEVDASVQPLMQSAQLFLSGIEYSFNTNRMIFNKVDYAMLRRNDGTLEAIEPDRLYSVVTGMYCGQMLGAVESTSMGLLSITPREKDGTPIAVENLGNYVVKDENGVPVKEWYAIASYLKEMGGEMDAKYAQPDGRKVVYTSLNPADLLRNANKFTCILIVLVVVIVAAVVLIITSIVRKIRRRRAVR